MDGVLAGELDGQGGGVGRARPQPRAAAPGAAAHGHQARAGHQPAAARLRRARRALGHLGRLGHSDALVTGPRPATGSRTPGASCDLGHDGDGFAFDNEGPRHDALLHPFALRSTARDQRRLARLRRRRRLPRARVCGCPTAGAPCSPNNGRRPSTGSATPSAGRVQTLDGARARRSGRAGGARELVRGRRLRPLGRESPAHRGRVGGGRRRPRARRPGHRLLGRAPAGRRRAVVRRGVAVDRQPVRPVPRVPARRRRGRRVQRQVHGQPAGAAGRRLRHAPRATPGRTYRNFFYPASRWSFCGLRLAVDK